MTSQIASPRDVTDDVSIAPPYDVRDDVSKALRRDVTDRLSIAPHVTSQTLLLVTSQTTRHKPIPTLDPLVVTPGDGLVTS